MDTYIQASPRLRGVVGRDAQPRSIFSSRCLWARTREGTYYASFMHGGRRYNVGPYETRQAAALAWDYVLFALAACGLKPMQWHKLNFIHTDPESIEIPENIRSTVATVATVASMPRARRKPGTGRRTRSSKYGLDVLAPGQSIFLVADRPGVQRIRLAASIYGKRHGLKFGVTRTESGCHLSRII